jgi:hypothetical protein
VVTLDLTDLDYGGEAGAEPSPEETRARAACTDVVVTTFLMIDAGQGELARRLFTEDAVHSFNGKEFAGPALTAMLLDRDQLFKDGRNTRHALSSTLFRLTGPDSALVRSIGAIYLLSHEDPGARRIPGGIVDVRDTLHRRTGGGWQIARRDINLAAVDEGQNELHEAGFATGAGR